MPYGDNPFLRGVGPTSPPGPSFPTDKQDWNPFIKPEYPLRQPQYEGDYVPPSNNPFMGVANAQIRLGSMDYNIPKPEEPKSLLSNVLGALQWIDQKTGAPIRAFTREFYRVNDTRQTAEDWSRSWKAAVDTFKGEREAMSGSDVIRAWVQDPVDYRAMGYSEEEARAKEAKHEKHKDWWLNDQAGRNVTSVLGFGLDVLQDPTNLIGVGGADDAAKLLAKKYGPEFVNSLEATLRAEGIIAEGEKVGQAAIEEYLKQSRRGLADAMPDLEKGVASAQGRVNRSLSGFFGEGAADYVRGFGDDVPVDQFMGVLSNKLKNDAPMLASTMSQPDLVTRVTTKLQSFGHTLDATAVGNLTLLEPTQLATIDTMVDLFGNNITVSGYQRAAKALGKTTKSGELVGVKKIGKFISEKYSTELDALKAIEDAKAPLQEASKLEAVVHDGGVWFRFGGLDLVDLSPVKQFTGQQFKNLYASSPAVQSVVDTLGENFVTKYLKGYTKLAQYTAPEAYGQLREMAKTVNEFERASKSTFGIATSEMVNGIDTADISRTMGEDVLEAVFKSKSPEVQTTLNALGVMSIDDLGARMDLGRELASNEKVMNAVPYFIEQTKGAEELVRWNKIAAQLSPEETVQVMEAAAKGRLFTEVQKQIDLKLLAGTTDMAKVPKEIVEELDKLYGDADTYVLHLLKPQAQDEIMSLIRNPLGEAADVRVKTAPKHSSMESRKFKSLSVAEEAGRDPITNYAVLLAARQAYARKAILADRLIKDLLSLTDIVTTNPKKAGFVSGAMEELTRAFEEAEWRNLGHIVSRLNGRYAHPEVVRHLKNLSTVFTTDGGFNTMMRWFSKVTNGVKGLQTASLSFTLRNIVGEGFMAFIDGVTPDTVVQSAKALTARTGTFTVAGRTFDVKDEMTNFGKLGGWFSGVTRGNLMSSANDIIQREVGLATKGGFPLHMVNDFNDRLWRFSHYMEYRAKGYSVKDAVQKVRQFHVDYDDLTKVERNVMRNIVPFYTYMRKNLPNVARILFEQPGIYSTLGHLVDNAYDRLGNPDTSEYLHETLAIPLFRMGNGDVVMLNWNLPITDLARIKSPFTGEGIREYASTLNPLLTAPIQLGLNRNLATNREIMAPGSEYADAAKFAVGQLGILGRGVSESGLIDESFGLIDETNTNRPEQLPVMSTLGSVLPIQRPVSVATSKAYKYRDQLLAEIARLRKTGKYVPTVQQVEDGVPNVFRQVGEDYNPFLRVHDEDNPFMR